MKELLKNKYFIFFDECLCPLFAHFLAIFGIFFAYSCTLLLMVEKMTHRTLGPTTADGIFMLGVMIVFSLFMTLMSCLAPKRKSIDKDKCIIKSEGTNCLPPDQQVQNPANRF